MMDHDQHHMPTSCHRGRCPRMYTARLANNYPHLRQSAVTRRSNYADRQSRPIGQENYRRASWPSPATLRASQLHSDVEAL